MYLGYILSCEYGEEEEEEEEVWSRLRKGMYGAGGERVSRVSAVGR